MEKELEINIQKLREDLIDYYGTAMFNGFPQAMMELEEIKRASDEKLLELAINKGINLNDYIKNSYTYKRY